jgi:hypothetical protein
VLERFVVAYDIGRAVNPMLVEGQIAGGAAQGLGGALLEEFLYAPDGQPLSVTLADYMMPTAREMPEVEILLTEDAPSGNPRREGCWGGRDHRRRRRHRRRRGRRAGRRRPDRAPTHHPFRAARPAPRRHPGRAHHDESLRSHR